jgi:hypothetical protein
VRATLHDGLMREAGFATDYQRGREHRRRWAIRVVIASAWLLAIAAVVVQFVDVETRHRVVPVSLAIAALIVAPSVPVVIRLMKRRTSRRREGTG